jgi:hypothetical protein
MQHISLCRGPFDSTQHSLTCYIIGLQRARGTRKTRRESAAACDKGRELRCDDFTEHYFVRQNCWKAGCCVSASLLPKGGRRDDATKSMPAKLHLSHLHRLLCACVRWLSLSRRAHFRTGADLDIYKLLVWSILIKKECIKLKLESISSNKLQFFRFYLTCTSNQTVLRRIWLFCSLIPNQ